MRMKLLANKTALVISILISSLLMSCDSVNTSGQYTYVPPENINDGLEVGSLKDVNINEGMIVKAVGRIQQGKYKEVHSMLIFKDNKLVLEEYFQGHKYKWDAPYYRGEWLKWDRTMKHQIMSCTKSVTSACINIAIANGFIQNVKQSIFDYLPHHQQFNSGQKQNITIEHLLTMTSGLKWDEWHAPHGTAANDIDRLYLECYEDPLSCVLERSQIHTPGESFNYNGGGIIILGEILRNATGKNIIEFSKQYLFGPLGIDCIQWDCFPKGEVEAASGLHLRPRDMLKIGVTYLNDGVWKGERIISADWVAKSSKVYRNNSGIRLPIEDSGKNGYGYTWWISEAGSGGNKTRMYRANGWGGQVIMVFPELEMVVVFTGGNYTRRSSLFGIIERFVLPAVN
jgi:CubicO group peptidase (beta-lactamase class C family)